MLKVTRAAFAVTCFWGLSDIHQYLGHLEMAAYPLGKQTTSCNSLHDWLMSLGIDVAALCDMWRWKWYQWMSFAGFSEDVAFDHHFMATRLHSQPIGVPLVLATPVKTL